MILNSITDAGLTLTSEEKAKILSNVVSYRPSYFVQTSQEGTIEEEEDEDTNRDPYFLLEPPSEFILVNNEPWVYLLGKTVPDDVEVDMKISSKETIDKYLTFDDELMSFEYVPGYILG